MGISKTERGFDLIEFKDLYEKYFSIQKSSLANQDAIWFGVDDAEPLIEGENGLRKYVLPDGVSVYTRMHLTRDHVKEIIPILQKFVDTGEIS